MTSAHSLEPTPTTQATEPAISSGLLLSFSSVIFGAITILGLPLTDSTKFWVMLAISFLGPIISALRIRGLVFSPATWERAQHQAALVLQDLASAEAEIAAHGAVVDALGTAVVDALQAVIPQPLPPPVPGPAAQPPTSTPWGPYPTYISPQPSPPPYQDPALSQTWGTNP